MKFAQCHLERAIDRSREYREPEHVVLANFILAELPVRGVRIVGAFESENPGRIEYETHAAEASREP